MSKLSLSLSVDPPFIEKIANFVSEKNMKMPVGRTPNVQFESKKYYAKLKHDITEADQMTVLEHGYMTALQTDRENQRHIINHGRAAGGN